VECQTKQAAFETQLCAQFLNAPETCPARRECSVAVVDAYSTLQGRVREQESSRKMEFRAAMRVLCLLRVLNTSGSHHKTQLLDSCVDMPEVSTGHLDLNYTSPRPAPECVEPALNTSLLPCAAGFSKMFYESKDWFEGAQMADCIPCTPPVNLIPAEFVERCPHEEGWHYLLDYSDDPSKDDVPDEQAEIAAGFSNSNAFYIGNAKLADLPIRAAQMCALASNARLEDGACQWSCADLPDSSEIARWPCSDSCNNLGSNQKKLIALLSGQAEARGGVFRGMPKAFFQGSASELTWYVQGRGGAAANVPEMYMDIPYYDAVGGWHVQGYGITLWRVSKDKEFGPHKGGAGTYPFDVDTFQIRVKLED